MKCSKCGLNEATRQVMVRINDSVERMYLCPECAKKYMPSNDLEDFDVFSKLINSSPMGLVSDLGKLFGAPASRSVVCPHCKTTSEDFIKTGFVGCGHCYEVFRPLVVQTVKKLQQSDRHVGKTPYGEPDAAEEERLRAELLQALDSGNSEKFDEVSARLKRLIDSKKEG